jgi:hypothetical protein
VEHLEHRGASVEHLEHHWSITGASTGASLEHLEHQNNMRLSSIFDAPLMLHEAF